MEIRIQSIHFDADEKLIAYTERKVGKLSSFFDRIIGVDVFLKFNSASSQIKEKSVEVKVMVPGTTLFAEEHNSTFEEGIDKAVDSLKQQLRKYKERFKN